MKYVYVLAAAISVITTSCDRDDYIPGTDEFQAGHTFNVKSSNGTVYVEFWDNECEDGDIIDFKINNIYERVELTNKPKRFEYEMKSGTYGLYVLAVNGTGYKGNCDFSDSNTHAVSVWSDLSGNPGRGYVYTSKAGAGTLHRINVTIP